MPRRPWTTGECERLRRLRAAGLSEYAIARELSRTRGSVNRQLTRLGLAGTKPPRWARWEKATLTRMARRGATGAEIADMLPGRTYFAVRRMAVLMRVPLPREGQPDLVRRAALLDYLADHPGANFTAAAAVLGGSPHSLWSMARRMVPLGLVARTGGHSRACRYVVTQKWIDGRKSA